MKKNLRLNELLLEYKVLEEPKLKQALEQVRKSGRTLPQVLIEEGLIKEDVLISCLCRHMRIPAVKLSRYQVSEKDVKIIPEHTARHYNLIALGLRGSSLLVAMSDPLNLLAIDDLKALTGYDIRPVVAKFSDINEAIGRYYHHKEKTAEEESFKEFLKDITEDVKVVSEQEQVDIGDVIRSSEEAPIVKMIDALIAEALIKRSSDIHIEPYERDIRIRYRIDGALQEAAVLPKKIQNAVIARLKIMSNLDITQRHVPQDGRFKVRLNEKEVDFRVSVLPVSFGEKVVLRALDKANLSIGLERLGFLPDAREKLQLSVQRPYGMILITGPTGSGKSTSLYSMLSILNQPEKNIITVEDPVEYQVEGITQVQVKPDIGLSFATGLRSILRQNPDILMVGEIRDFETADIAIKAALTGALLLSTLHTNDAAGAIVRLIDMGVEPFLISSSVIAVAAQRLARRICFNCREPYTMPQSVFDRLNLTKKAEDITVYRGRGCEKCSNTGYSGRFAMLEIMLVTPSIREMILKRCSSDEIKKQAITEQNMMTLRDTGIQKFLDGETTLEEVLRITSRE